jgi:hypothetical protein
VNDSFDEFGFLDLGVRFVAPFELRARQAIARHERRRTGRPDRCARHSIPTRVSCTARRNGDLYW